MNMNLENWLKNTMDTHNQADFEEDISTLKNILRFGLKKTKTPLYLVEDVLNQKVLLGRATLSSFGNRVWFIPPPHCVVRGIVCEWLRNNVLWLSDQYPVGSRTYKITVDIPERFLS